MTLHLQFLKDQRRNKEGLVFVLFLGSIVISFNHALNNMLCKEPPLSSTPLPPPILYSLPAPSLSFSLPCPFPSLLPWTHLCTTFLLYLNATSKGSSRSWKKIVKSLDDGNILVILVCLFWFARFGLLVLVCSFWFACFGLLVLIC